MNRHIIEQELPGMADGPDWTRQAIQLFREARAALHLEDNEVAFHLRKQLHREVSVTEIRRWQFDQEPPTCAILALRDMTDFPVRSLTQALEAEGTRIWAETILNSIPNMRKRIRWLSAKAKEHQNDATKALIVVLSVVTACLLFHRVGRLFSLFIAVAIASAAAHVIWVPSVLTPFRPATPVVGRSIRSRSEPAPGMTISPVQPGGANTATSPSTSTIGAAPELPTPMPVTTPTPRPTVRPRHVVSGASISSSASQPVQQVTAPVQSVIGDLQSVLPTPAPLPSPLPSATPEPVPSPVQQPPPTLCSLLPCAG